MQIHNKSQFVCICIYAMHNEKKIKLFSVVCCIEIEHKYASDIIKSVHVNTLMYTWIYVYQMYNYKCNCVNCNLLS